MITQAQYKAQSKFALLLLGAPKTRKTTLALSFPSPGIIDADLNLAGPLRHYPSKDIHISTIDVDDTGAVVPRAKRWLRLVSELNVLATTPEVKTLIIDTIGKVHTYLVDYLIDQNTSDGKRVSGEPVMTTQLWYPYGVLLERLVNHCRASGKLVVVTSHLRESKDEQLGFIQYGPTVSGQTGDRFGGFFTDVWCCDYKAGKYIVNTKPSARMSLGRSLDLPDEFEFNWDVVQAKLNEVDNI